MDEIQKELVNIEKSIVKLFNEKKIKEILQFFSKDFIGFSSTKQPVDSPPGGRSPRVR